jgi:hypothetical protein
MLLQNAGNILQYYTLQPTIAQKAPPKCWQHPTILHTTPCHSSEGCSKMLVTSYNTTHYTIP